jgi:predicted metal-dependent phosphoesterase TrpH
MANDLIDLHMHSFYSSDGQFTPYELADQCAAAGIAVMSVADHNCARANFEAAHCAALHGISYIPGIEIDCTWEGTDLHVLGYGIEWRDPAYARIEENIAAQNEAASLQTMKGLQALGFGLSAEEMKAMEKGRYWQNCWTGEMFAETLLARENLKDHPLLKPYRKGGSRSDNPYVNFYWDYCSQGKPGYAPMHFPSAEEILKTIHATGGKAVLAHPGVNMKQRWSELPRLLEIGFDGIEAFSSYHGSETSSECAALADQMHLLITCGSDYHGKTKPAIHLGGHGCTRAPEEIRKNLGAAGLITA